MNEPIKYGEIKEILNVRYYMADGSEMHDAMATDEVFRHGHRAIMDAVSELLNLGVKVEVNYP